MAKSGRTVWIESSGALGGTTVVVQVLDMLGAAIDPGDLRRSTVVAVKGMITDRLYHTANAGVAPHIHHALLVAPSTIDVADLPSLNQQQAVTGGFLWRACTLATVYGDGTLPRFDTKEVRHVLDVRSKRKLGGMQALSLFWIMDTIALADGAGSHLSASTLLYIP
jgi:hypothetical protein